VRLPPSNGYRYVTAGSSRFTPHTASYGFALTPYGSVRTIAREHSHTFIFYIDIVSVSTLSMHWLLRYSHFQNQENHKAHGVELGNTSLLAGQTDQSSQHEHVGAMEVFPFLILFCFSTVPFTTLFFLF
jgi:hypothetical protein